MRELQASRHVAASELLRIEEQARALGRTSTNSGPSIVASQTLAWPGAEEDHILETSGKDSLSFELGNTTVDTSLQLSGFQVGVGIGLDGDLGGAGDPDIVGKSIVTGDVWSRPSKTSENTTSATSQRNLSEEVRRLSEKLQTQAQQMAAYQDLSA